MISNDSLINLVADEREAREIESLGWHDLVSLKRKLSDQLKELTDKIVAIDNNESQRLSAEIRERRAQLENLTERLNQIRSEVERKNVELLAVSEKISQSKNFVSIMEGRLPAEKEDELRAVIQRNQTLIDSKTYRSEREKDEILSRGKDASMKLEAIKATRTIREQFLQLSAESRTTADFISRLNEERDSIKKTISEINSGVDNLYDSKRKLHAERDSRLLEYDAIAKQFDSINYRLDAMAQMRRKQREEYGHGLPNDALFKVKESARKKLESGAKLTFEELKLLYGEKD
jgi:uncharacterized coiled-coil DUF342 family protein